MQLTSPAPVKPIGVSINISTHAGGGGSFPLTDSQGVSLRFEPGATVSASRSIFDQLWDGPVAQPADPRDWRAEVRSDATPRLADAVAGLQDALAGVDLTRVPYRPATEREYATLYVRFAERPTGVDHLHTFQDRDGTWLVPTRTSQNDLFVDPQLGPVVDAARDVLAAARPR